MRKSLRIAFEGLLFIAICFFLIMAMIQWSMAGKLELQRREWEEKEKTLAQNRAEEMKQWNDTEEKRMRLFEARVNKQLDEYSQDLKKVINQHQEEIKRIGTAAESAQKNFTTVTNSVSQLKIEFLQLQEVWQRKIEKIILMPRPKETPVKKESTEEKKEENEGKKRKEEALRDRIQLIRKQYEREIEDIRFAEIREISLRESRISYLMTKYRHQRSDYERLAVLEEMRLEKEKIWNAKVAYERKIEEKKVEMEISITRVKFGIELPFINNYP